MKFSAESFVHRMFPSVERDSDGKEVEKLFHFAIVDEVDSILIDEARTPLIISGPAEASTELYYAVDRIIPNLRRDLHYAVDEKSRTVTLTEEGVPRAEELLHVENLYDPEQMTLLHHLTQALRAHALYKREKDYTIKDGKVVIVDEFTGRLMPGRRWSDGLHQAVEAKENVKIEAREPDARDDHVPELLPDVPEAQRDDRHRGNGGRRVREDLRARGRADPDEPRPGARRARRCGLPDRTREAERDRRGDRRRAAGGPPDPGGNDLDREERTALPAPEAPARAPRGAERQVPPAGSRNRGPGRRQRLRHDRHEHGRSGHRHHPRRQRRRAREGRSAQAGGGMDRGPRRGLGGRGVGRARTNPGGP